MKFFKQIITAAVAIGALSVSVFAIEQKNDQKPPKEPKVVERPEKQQPPPRNENRGNQGRDRGGNDNRRGRP
jgi:hypothetical protein